MPLASCHEYWLAGHRASGVYSVQLAVTALLHCNYPPSPLLPPSPLPAQSRPSSFSAFSSSTPWPLLPASLSLSLNSNSTRLPFAELRALVSVADHTAARHPFLLATSVASSFSLSSSSSSSLSQSSGSAESGLFVAPVQYACGVDALALARRSAYCMQSLRFWCYRSSIRCARVLYFRSRALCLQKSTSEVGG